MKVLNFLAQYLGIRLSGTAFGKTLSFKWGVQSSSRAVIEVSVTGLTIGLTAGIYF